MDYMTGGAPLPPYFPYPRFLLGSGLSQTAQLLYAVLLDRASLSRANGWTDEKGYIFIVYPLDKLAKTMHKGETATKKAVRELERTGYLERHRCGPGQPNRLYIKQPRTGRFPTPRQAENRPSDSRKCDRQTGGKATVTPIIKNNIESNNMRGVTGGTPPVGRYQNVFLSETELGELQNEYPGLWQEYIERLSSYMASTGKTYANHAATLRRWLSSDRKKSGLPDYTCGEDESL